MDNSLSVEKIWENFKYAKKHFEDLSEPFVVDNYSYEISDDSKKWDKEYFLTAAASLDTNFNERRYRNVLAARDHLRRSGHEDFKYITPTTRS